MLLTKSVELAGYVLFGAALGLAVYRLLSLALYPGVRAARAGLAGIKRKSAIVLAKGGNPLLENRKYQLTIVGFSLTFGLLALGSRFIIAAGTLGLMVGIGVAGVMEYLSGKNLKIRKMREVILLYEMIDLLTTKCSYTVYSALQLTETMLPILSQAVRKCLNRWPFGALRALDELGNDIGIPEAQVLITILQAAQEAGTARLAGVLAEEAVKVEEYRKKIVEISMENRPIYQGLYVHLPFTVLLGMFMGPMVWNLLGMMTGTMAPMAFFH